MPKANAEEKQSRSKAINDATINAIEVPLKVMKTSLKSFSLLKRMASSGNPNSLSDAGVGALCARAAVHGAYLNVLINSKDLDDKKYVEKTLKDAKKLLKQAITAEKDVLATVEKGMK